MRERRPSLALNPFSGWETLIVGITALAPDSSAALMSGITWVDAACVAASLALA
jgi:hypothetical protein